MIIVIGIDPGIANTGIASVSYYKGKYKVLDTQIVKTDSKLTTAERLEIIKLEFIRFVERNENWKFDLLSMEDVFFGKNVKSARQTCKVIGVLEITAYEKYRKLFTILTPTAVKKGVGAGGASGKDGISFAIASITGEMLTNNHEADAAAVAISAHKSVPF